MTKKKKVKRMKDPNAPKRALSGFFWFSNEERPKVQAANPDFKVQLKISESHTLIKKLTQKFNPDLYIHVSIKVGDVAKELGRRWADCDPSTKQK